MISLSTIKNKIQTGDIILSSGSSIFSKIIKEFTGCKWSHVAMAVRGEDVGWTPGKLYVWESTGKGVTSCSFEDSCRSHIKNDFSTAVFNAGSGDLAIRHLKLLDEFVRPALIGLKHHIDVYDGTPYETNRMELLRAVPWVRFIPVTALGVNEQCLTSQFCWEAVAAAYQSMGLLPENVPANTYSNKDWADDMYLELEAYLENSYEFRL